MAEIVIDVEAVGERLLSEAATSGNIALAQISAAELQALAQYAIKPIPEHVISASLAAAIAAVVRDRKVMVDQAVKVLATGGEDPEFSAENTKHGSVRIAFAESLDRLQTLFEKEFPNGTAD